MTAEARRRPTWTTLFLLLWALPVSGGGYLGASLGRADVDEHRGALELDDQDVAFKLYGGYRIVEALAFEAGYVRLGQFRGKAGSIPFDYELDGFTFHGVVSLPLGERFAALARVGYFYWQADLDAAGVSLDEDGWDFIGGLGLGYRFSERWTAVAEWERYATDADLDVYSAGIRYHF
jgi:hypothetical protein